MKLNRKLNRRSFVARVAGGAAAAAGFAALGRGEAAALQVTDRDFGQNADPAGQGRGNAGRSGLTDSDPSDSAGNGRGLVIEPRGSTGNSPGAGAQSNPYNSGSGGTGAPGASASPSATTGATDRRCTDSDVSPSADPVRGGRRC